MDDIARVLITLGGLLLVGLVTEALGRRTRLPRVTLMLLLGFCLGPSALDLIPGFAEDWFPMITNMALVMVGFLLGERLSGSVLRRNGRQVVFISISVVLFTGLLVFLGMLAMGYPWRISLLLAGIAPATAPAATADVVNEQKAVGPFSATLLAIVALDDAWGLLLFSFVLAAVESAGAGPETGALAAGLWEVGAAIALGVFLGLPMAYLTGRIEPGEPTLAEALGTVLLCGGLALALGVSPLLAALTMGVVVANLARHHERPFHAIERIDWPFLILFFVLAGATLELTAIAQAGWIIAAYVTLRVAGRLVGALVGVRMEGTESPRFGLSMGLALMPQAGVALGMALFAAQRFPEFEGLLSLVISSTVAFELFGPILTRWAIVRQGEAARGGGAPRH